MTDVQKTLDPLSNDAIPSPSTPFLWIRLLIFPFAKLHKVMVDSADTLEHGRCRGSVSHHIDMADHAGERGQWSIVRI